MFLNQSFSLWFFLWTTLWATQHPTHVINEEREDPIQHQVEQLFPPSSSSGTEPKKPEDGQQTLSEDQPPWRIQQQLPFQWLRFELEQRSRFEQLINNFRQDETNQATALLLRSLFIAQLQINSFHLYTEWIDARIYATEQTPIRISFTDPIDLLQAYSGLQLRHIIQPQDTLSFLMGRMTLNLGSRRLVARNGFRNTISAFTGLDMQWIHPQADWLQVFIGFPVTRRPTEQQTTVHNTIVFNTENFYSIFWAIYWQNLTFTQQFRFECYLYGLHEQYNPHEPSRQRQILTPGIRLLRQPQKQMIDYDIEWMGQAGQVQQRLADNGAIPLTHLAFSSHLSLGYTFSWPLRPRILLFHDYATGGQSLGKKFNHRFDTLYGARRFEFGPTSYYGILSRSNIQSPGLRFEIQPDNNIDGFIAYRLVWLAAQRDVWPTANLQDPSGESGSFVGQHFEIRMRWHLFPDNLAFDTGGAFFLPGSFARRTIPEPKSLPIFIYLQMTLRI